MSASLVGSEMCIRDSPFTEYHNPHKLELARVIQESCVYLSDKGDGDPLSDELLAKWGRVLTHHEGTRRILFEAHNDVNTFFMHARIIFENAAGKTEHRMEFSTWRDDEEGSTGKGTSRSWIEAAPGP
eukprot:11740773-Alexandrium_andersonii.AAC.1